jgi:transposase InsO family protein
LQDLRTKKTIGLGKQRDRLYYLVALASQTPKHQPPSAATTLPSSQVASSTALWHRRLGHLSSSRLDFMAKHLLNFSFQSNNACDVCALAKQSRLPFSVSSISSVRPFELIHCDIWGPYKIASSSGAKYFLTIVDDYSRFTWVFFIHHKSETQYLLANFFSFVQTQFHVSIANIRVDNGGEFFSMRDFFKQQETIYQHSCVYTPQQNGVVERKHRHILESARAFRFQAHLPLHFWAECVSTAVHIINRLPTPLLSHQTPFERLLENSLLILIFESLHVLPMLLLCMSPINLPLVPDVAFFLAIPSVRKLINSMTSQLIKCSLVVMLFFMKQYFHMSPFHPLHPLLFPSFLSLYPTRLNQILFHPSNNPHQYRKLFLLSHPLLLILLPNLLYAVLIDLITLHRLYMITYVTK